MITHLVCFLWALQTLWSLKEISAVNRVRLWVKTMKLHTALIGFADTPRTPESKQRIVEAALLTAIYDYDTDWKATQDPESSLTFRLMQKYVLDQRTLKIGKELFLVDWGKQLSHDALERGGEALLFYARFIGAQWLNAYSDGEIRVFGRKLQILDDIDDLADDHKNGHTNCFLLSADESVAYAAELQEFFRSNFFRQLSSNSMVYALMKYVCLRNIERLDRTPQLQWSFVQTGRLLTGVYAAVATLVGFSPFEAMKSGSAIFAAIAFALITTHIMSFNDYVDRVHDRAKGRLLVSDYPKEFARYLSGYAGIVLLALLLLTLSDGWLAAYCAGVWVLGLAYSYMRRLFMVQNLVVALCSASPILCGAVHARAITWLPELTFVALATTILMSEIVKDIQDQAVDYDYKRTIPVVQGRLNAVMALFPLTQVLAACLVFHPYPLARYAAFGLVVLWYPLSQLFTRGRIECAKTVESMLTVVVAVILVFAILAP